MIQDLPDHLRPGMKILFVGFNPGIRSGRTGHHYASPSNRFWSLLHRAGLTPRRYRPEEDSTLPELGFGLTNIVHRTTRAAADITPEEYRAGREELRGKIERLRPRAVCFVGKGVYQAYSGRREVDWGEQPVPVSDGVIEYVVPSSSGLVSLPPAQVEEIYRGLRRYL